MLESVFQKRLMRKLKQMFPECVVIKNDCNCIQGIPDLLILYKNKWAMLECKRSKDADHQPNQDYYVELFNSMSFARFIFPENQEEVLNELQQTFKS